MIKRLRSDSERGFTIIEIMVAITLLLVAVLGVSTMADSANVVSTTTKARVGATNLARELLEDARGFKYSELSGNVPAGSNTKLQDAFANLGITDARPSQPGFQVTRRGIVYTVDLFSCVFDDSHDGARPAPGAGNPDVNAAGPYCLGSAAAGSGTSDSNPDDARKLEASVSWTFRGTVPNCKGANQTIASGTTGGAGLACVTQSELISNPTGGLGPTILTLTNAPTGTVESGNSVVMNATTVTGAQSVTWTSDDGSSGTAGPAAGDTDGTHWTFTWTLGSTSPADGTHLLTAQAFLLNAGGVPKQTAVQLNRFIPASPQVTAGGVDSRKSAEPASALNWIQNADSDILGYTVYRAKGAAPDLTSNNADTPVCSTASVAGTSCFDAPGAAPNDLQSFATNGACLPNLPAAQAAGDVCVNYYVVPFDQKWTTGNPPTYTSAPATCGAGFPWSSVDVPTPPVAASNSVPPLTNSPLWSTARVGCPSAFITVDYTTGIANTAPAAPTPAATQCSTDAGQPVISWVAPPSPDAGNPPNDPQDAVESFRIYRDPPTNPPGYNNDATTINYASGTVSFEDPNPTGGTDHTYYVTAVDARFQESQPLAITWSGGACP